MDKSTKIKLMHRASRLGNVEQLEEVLHDPEVKERINMRAGTHKQTALHEACQENQPRIVDTLLGCADIVVDSLDSRNWTPLCYAVNSGNIETVLKLIHKGANVNHVLNNGDTPLHIASMKCYVNICKLLIDQGADVKSVNKFQWSPLHCASGEGAYELVQLLLSKSAPVDGKTTYGDTASNMAARNDSEDILKLFKLHKADFNICNNNGEAPVHSAAMGGRVLILKYLVQNGASAMACVNKQMNLFHLAAKNGHIDVFYIMKETLSSKEFNQLLNAKTDHINGVWISTIGCGIILSHVTPIHLAALEGHSALVKILIQAGANKDEKDGNGHTPLELVHHFKSQIQLWDIDNIESTMEVLDKYTLGRAVDADDQSVHPSFADSVSVYHDSDYYSTSSVTTEDVESNMGDLEAQIRQMEIGNATPKYVHRKRRNLQRKVERSAILDNKEKADILGKLSAIEETIKMISEKGVTTTQILGRDTRPKTPGPLGTGHVSKELKNAIAKNFRAHFTTFLREIKADDHIHFLFQQGAIELVDVQKVESKSTEDDKVKTLLYLLFAKPNKNWTTAFVESLENHEFTMHLVTLLMN